MSGTSGALAIVGGRVVPVADEDGRRREPVDEGTVLIEDGVITAVGTEVALPPDCEVVQAAGQWVLPGFVEPHAHIGLHEEGEGAASNDANEQWNADAAMLRAIDGITPQDMGFRDALRGGITTAVVKPGSGNPIGGRSAAVKTWGRIVEEMLVSQDVSIKSALGENPKRFGEHRSQRPSTRMGTAAELRRAFAAAADYLAECEVAAAEGRHVPRDLVKEALAEVLSGRLAWDQHAHRADDIATAVRLSEEFGYRLVLNHGTEAHLLADYLAERDIPVIYGPLFTSRSKAELRGRAIANAGALARAGLTLALTTDHPVVPIDFLVYQAAIAVKEGLDPVIALEALTVNPATIFGLHERVGSLAPGRDGDVVLWSGDPLDVRQRALAVYISGTPVYRWDAEARRPVYAEFPAAPAPIPQQTG